ncbi:dihydrofolate reductase [Pseudomonas syringae pv. actinidiae]|nr:dihydrofolate reductase [Pseudomonas syringae pv. actinidiae]
MSHKIGAIVAITAKGVLGNGLELPWPKGAIKGDLPHFKKVTNDAVIVMGGKTHLSIGGVLPNRINIVVSQTIEETEGVKVYPSLSLALGFALTMNKPIWIIGGAQILKQALKLRVIDSIWVTRVHRDYPGDVILDWNEDFLADQGFLRTSSAPMGEGEATVEYWGAL